MSGNNFDAGTFPAARENPGLVGHEDAERNLRQGFESGRLAHAWLISGPQGIGKATLAYRFARYVLAHGTNEGGGDAAGAGLFGESPLPGETSETPEANGPLYLAPGHPVFQRVASGGHVDLISVERTINEKTGKALTMEVLLVSPAFERIMLPMVKNLKRLGVETTVRTVDSAQYQNRLNDFDFDAIVFPFAQSLSPGNEQRDFWGSYNADAKGSRNFIGVKDPAVDDLIETIIAAPDRAALIAATRALDRVLLWGHYVVPQWHIQSYRIAYWDRFGRPAQTPKYGLGFSAWWIDAAKDFALQAARTGSK